jgi:hypothetical protein
MSQRPLADSGRTGRGRGPIEAKPSAPRPPPIRGYIQRPVWYVGRGGGLERGSQIESSSVAVDLQSSSTVHALCALARSLTLFSCGKHCTGCCFWPRSYSALDGRKRSSFLLLHHHSSLLTPILTPSSPPPSLQLPMAPAAQRSCCTQQSPILNVHLPRANG